MHASSNDPAPRYDSILDTVGNTPVVRLSSYPGPDAAAVWVKLEAANPTGSYKDRMALAMIEGYALTASPLFKKSAQQGVDFILKARNPYLAWRYGVRPGDNDTSVTGWQIMALKSGGTPLYVAPLVFAGAPIVNVLISITWHKPKTAPEIWFYLGVAEGFEPAVYHLSAWDPTVAPPGQHWMSNFVQYCPAELADGAWTPEKRDAFGETVISKLEHYSPGFRDLIVHMDLFRNQTSTMADYVLPAASVTCTVPAAGISNVLS